MDPAALESASPTEPTTPLNPVQPIDPIASVGPDGNASSGDSAGTSKYVLRPEAGSYIANLIAANAMSNLMLQKRSGETQYTAVVTGEESRII